MTKRSLIVLLTLITLVAVNPQAADAIKIAVFGDNAADDFINATFGAGSATLVSDANLATAGFLSAFDTVLITRDGASFGSGLSAAAAANVIAYVGGTGAVVLFNNDMFDALPGSFTPHPIPGMLLANAVLFAVASGHGYIGEFNGAVMGLTANSNGFVPLGFVVGSADPLTCCPADGLWSLTLAGLGHPVTGGVPFPFDVADIEFGSIVTGVGPSFILAVTPDGNPVIIARGAAVPEPSTLLLLGSGLIGLAALRRLRK